MVLTCRPQCGSSPVMTHRVLGPRATPPTCRQFIHFLRSRANGDTRQPELLSWKTFSARGQSEVSQLRETTEETCESFHPAGSVGHCGPELGAQTAAAFSVNIQVFQRTLLNEPESHTHSDPGRGHMTACGCSSRTLLWTFRLPEDGGCCFERPLTFPQVKVSTERGDYSSDTDSDGKSSQTTSQINPTHEFTTAATEQSTTFKVIQTIDTPLFLLF